MRTHAFTISEFYCTKCGNKGIPIGRPVSLQREFQHYKKLYCLHCREEVNHVEIRAFDHYSYEDFKKDFEEGKFIQEEIIDEKKKCL
jgi:hypothetical protein